MEHSIVFFFAIIIILGALLFAFISSVNRKSVKNLDVEYFRANCLKNEHQLKQDEPSSYHLSVLNADKLVDQALKGRRIRGKTMGERMKNASELFSDKNGIWAAHKLRNRVAHESDAYITYNDARNALKSFRTALKDLGAI